MIETARLLLRPWRSADRAAYAALCSSPAVMAHLGGPIGPDQADAAIERACAKQDQHGFSFWAMERRADGAMLGFCGPNVIASSLPVDGEVEIGWRLSEHVWGQGYAREAALATLRWCWRETPLARVIAMTVPANHRSWGLMERIGMMRDPERDFGHPAFPDGHPLHRHIVYTVARPR
ncbi:GNAT family N-acetyltransferase [Sphingomonas sp. ASY06-1R]|jgi:RimJ/RimL family protein N-acetyltransferase|uniref:GNAT family N-acetyltransferase n=1 Tax=Sphingomonas sp. ASY06-1R TaxID=3445771 RepID=UPI003FA244E0